MRHGLSVRAFQEDNFCAAIYGGITPRGSNTSAHWRFPLLPYPGGAPELTLTTPLTRAYLLASSKMSRARKKFVRAAIARQSEGAHRGNQRSWVVRCVL